MDKRSTALVIEALLKDEADYEVVVTHRTVSARWIGAAKRVSSEVSQQKRKPCPLGCGKNVAPTGRGSHYRVCPKRPKS